MVVLEDSSVVVVTPLGQESSTRKSTTTIKDNNKFVVANLDYRPRPIKWIMADILTCKVGHSFKQYGEVLRRTVVISLNDISN